MPSMTSAVVTALGDKTVEPLKDNRAVDEVNGSAVGGTTKQVMSTSSPIQRGVEGEKVRLSRKLRMIQLSGNK